MRKSPRKRSSSKVWFQTADTIVWQPRPQLQSLPKLPWEFFQRLCARIAWGQGDVEDAREYGVPGQAQEGIDILVKHWKSTAYACWQCKRYQEADAKIIESSVDEFLEGEWASKTEEFVLCISAEIEEKSISDAIELQRQRLTSRGIKFRPKGLVQLATDLKSMPQVVFDFFGRQAVIDLCGESLLHGLKCRLEPSDAAKLRKLLRNCYAAHFETTDPGVPGVSSVLSTVPPFVNRYVIPDVSVRRAIRGVETPPERPRGGEHLFPPKQISVKSSEAELVTDSLTWLSLGDRNLVVGDPGSGKSSFLRYLILSLLDESLPNDALARKWSNRLPVWIPFSMWTRLVEESEQACSLSRLLEIWLDKASANQDLKRLVAEALQDARLLLLVDGLDEWSNETAARSTLGLLEQFVREHDIPAVLSSRPIGLRRLGSLATDWNIADLTPLDEAQRLEMCKIWFLQKRKEAPNSKEETPERLEQLAAGDAETFAGELESDPQLAALSDNALLLSGLISLRMQGIRLPHSKTKAYQELTNIVLQEQPRRREKAAQARTDAMPFSPRVRLRALASLAYEIHARSSGSTMLREDAIGVLADSVTQDLGQNRNENKALAEQLLERNALFLGILVEPSPSEIAFSHRTFQEYLAAVHLGSLSREDQQLRFEELFRNPTWRDVLLCLCNLNDRPSEVDALVAVAQACTLPPEADVLRALFLAELTFSDSNCSPKTAQVLAESTFRIIETTPSESLRRHLLVQALGGLHNDILRDQVHKRLRRWYPNRYAYRSGAYEAIASWPDVQLSLEVLLSGLFDEEEFNQHRAAEAFIILAQRAPEIGGKLVELSKTSGDATRIAYSLHAAALVNPESPEVLEMLARADVADYGILRLVGKCHRILHGARSNDDLEQLLGFTFGHSPYLWTSKIVECLTSGWPNSPRVKALCLDSLSRYTPFHGRLDAGVVGRLVCGHFARDPDIIKAVATSFVSDDYPQHMLELDHDWETFVGAFQGNQIVGAAADEWLSKRTHLFWDSKLALVSKSARALELLVKPQADTGFISEWQASTLITGWGLGNALSRKALEELAGSSSGGSIAHLLPSIITNPETCRKVLVKLFEGSNEYVSGRALKGLVTLGSGSLDTRILELALERCARDGPENFLATLVASHPEDARVRKVALEDINGRGTALALTSKIYGNDSEVCNVIAERMRPLSDNARTVIARDLSRFTADDDLLNKASARINDDSSGTVKCAAGISIAKSLRTRRLNPANLITQLNELLTSAGPDYKERQQAAVGTLLELDRFDVAIDARLGDRPALHYFSVGGFRPNLELVHQLARYWDRIDSKFASGFLEMMEYLSGEILLELFTTTQSETLRRAVEEHVEKGGEKRTLLKIWSHSKPGSTDLEKACLHEVCSFAPRDWNLASAGIVAAEILADQFGDRDDIRDALIDALNHVQDPSAAVVALELGWRDSQWNLKSTPKPGALLPPAEAALFSHSANASRFVQGIGGAISSHLTDDIWDFLPVCARFFRQRFVRDANVQSIALERLTAGASAAEKCNFPQFLKFADCNPDKVIEWCRKEILLQEAKTSLPEIALDVVAGSYRAVGEVLRGLLVTL